MAGNLDSGRFGTINASVEFNKTNILSIDNLAIKVYDKENDIIFNEPENFYYQNLPLFIAKSTEITISAEYLYNPRSLSLKLYDTVDLFYLLLLLNDSASCRDFNKKKVLVFKPSEMPWLLNLIQTNKDKYDKSKATPTVLGEW